MSIALFCLLVLFLLIFMKVRRLGSCKYKLPPSPFRLPIIGNLYLMKKAPHLMLKDLSKKYGPIFTFWFGKRPVVLISNEKLAREALIHNQSTLSGRPQRYSGSLYSRGFKGIVLSDDDEGWKLRRKLGHQALRTLREEKRSLENIISVECKDLIEQIQTRKQHGDVMDLKENLTLCVLNVICALVFGSRYDVNDPEFLKIVEANAWFIEGIQSANIVDGLPILRYIPFRPLQLIKDFVKVRDQILERKLEEHRNTFNPSKMRDFTDILLQSSLELHSLKNEHLTRDHCLMLMGDLFLTGAETTATALAWAILYLTNWPEKQEKAYQEIKTVLGDRIIPEMSDKAQLPYLEALISEVLRKSSLVPLGIPHKATADTVIAGYHIPKGYIVLINYFALHHDQIYWSKPEDFEPERFLDKQEKDSKPSFLPFAAGKRVCLGEQLAKMELFLFLGCLLKTFRFEKLENSTLDLEGKFGATLAPKAFKVRVVSRTCDNNNN